MRKKSEVLETGGKSLAVAAILSAFVVKFERK